MVYHIYQVSTVLLFPVLIQMYLPVVEHDGIIIVEEEVLEAVHGDDQPRDDGAAQVEVPDELLLRDPGHGAGEEEVVEPLGRTTINQFALYSARAQDGPQDMERN